MRVCSRIEVFCSTWQSWLCSFSRDEDMWAFKLQCSVFTVMMVVMSSASHYNCTDKCKTLLKDIKNEAENHKYLTKEVRKLQTTHSGLFLLVCLAINNHVFILGPKNKCAKNIQLEMYGMYEISHFLYCFTVVFDIF